MTRDDVDLEAGADGDFSEVGDSSLAVALVRQRREALAEVFERHSGAVHDVAHRLGGDHVAMQVVQQTFLDLWRTPDEFDPASETLRAHLLTKAHCTAVDRVRAQAARATPPGIADARERTRSEQRSTMSANHAWPLLSRLPADERNAIWMTYFVGYTARELALRLHQPEGVIRQRIVDGLRRLRSLRAGGAGATG